MNHSENLPSKGILRPAAIDDKFTLSRHIPSDDLAFFIEHYWIVRCDLRGEEPYAAETLPFPSVHMVIETDRADVWGVVTGRIISERSVTSVEHVVISEGINKRSLQRLFNEYAGVGPKWVINRYRIQEAADRLVRGEDTDLPKLALDLGHFDQAHFIEDFKTIIGVSPGEYSRTAV